MTCTGSCNFADGCNCRRQTTTSATKINKFLTSNRSSYILYLNKEVVAIMGWDPELPVTIERKGNGLLLTQD